MALFEMRDSWEYWREKVTTAVAKIENITAIDIPYDGQSSGLSAENVQNAIDELSSKSVSIDILSSVALSGSYNDLVDKPHLSDVALTGSYNDLIDKPTLFSGNYDDLTNKPTLAIVATTGDYDDLLNKPTLFSGSYNDLTDKPTLFSGDYDDLTNKPTIYGAGTGLSLDGDNLSVNYGTTAGTACEGNDSRLSNARTPIAHSATTGIYGAGDSTHYGHVVVSDVYNTTVGTANAGVCASQGALYNVYNGLNTSKVGAWTIKSISGNTFTATEQTLTVSELVGAKEVLVRILIAGANESHRYIHCLLNNDAVGFFIRRSDGQYCSGYVKVSSAGVITYAFQENSNYAPVISNVYYR